MHQAIWAIALIIAILLLGWALGLRLGRSIRQLAGWVEELSSFDFSAPPPTSSHIREVNELQQATVQMVAAIGHFQSISASLSRELELERMLPVVLEHLVKMADGPSGVVYLCDEDKDLLERAAVYGDFAYAERFVMSESLPGDFQEALAVLKARYPRSLILPLHDRKGTLLGLLSIRLRDETDARTQAYLQGFLENLSGVLAVAIETRQLFEQQQALLESVIKVLAHAVDAKSPYTGGHCERVPELAEMLLEQAVAVQSGPLADYQPDEEERYAFRIAAWLHDCGERRPPVEPDDPRNIWGFDMHLPEYAHHLGELHNLTVRRGTLTPEERFKVNEHIVHTLVMLSTLPFPRALQQVPDIAANHHEKISGNGYPRRLKGEQLSVPARIMAIADIFEALTAADRPYKTAKTLSESISIMMRMAREQHIDAQLFSLFLSSGVYLRYAEQFLQPEQIDEVDVEGCLAQLSDYQ